ncbi:DUF3800 domain-containing protein [Sideroxydans sp.]
MYMLYCDESNLEEKDNDFFVYGGLVINGEAAQSLSLAIDSIRRTFKVPQRFVLKFNPGPEHLSHQDFIALKQAIVEAAIAHECIFLASMILHNVATSPAEARRNEINRICYHYDCFLSRPQSHGLVLIDRFEDKKIDGHLRDKFTTGITGLPYSKELRLERIVGFHYSAIGQSHFGSIIDIVLGSFRFAVNAFTRHDEEKIESANHLLTILSPLFLREGSDDAVSEISLFFSPKTIKSVKYRNMYSALASFLSDNGIKAAQKITNERTY